LEQNPKKKKSSSRSRAAKRKALLFGLGLDNKDGHVRITRGPNFQLIGGSQQTHEVMQETAIKFNEELKKRGKPLENLGPNEFVDILHKLKP
jgi:hypothetical protein